MPMALQTALEAASLGGPTVAIAMVENQRANVERLEAVGAVEQGALDESLSGRLRRLASDFRRRTHLGRTAREAVDGFGALRVAGVLEDWLARDAT